MKIEDQICSLELAERLKELGVKQSSLFWHGINWEGNKSIAYVPRPNPEEYVLGNACSAFTVAELGDMIPDQIDQRFIKCQKKDIEYKIYIDGLDRCIIFFDENEANARAKMLIYLLENKLTELTT